MHVRPTECGADVKVVGETPKGRASAMQEAACPKCGDKQLVYADKIISVTAEKDLTSK